MSGRVCDGCFWNEYDCEPTMFHGYNNGERMEYTEAICDMYTPIDPDEEEELIGYVIIPYEEFREAWKVYVDEDDWGDYPEEVE